MDHRLSIILNYFSGIKILGKFDLFKNLRKNFIFFSAYSYYIEISVDGKNWTRIINYRAYLCRSWQKLYFPPIVATYVL